VALPAARQALERAGLTPADIDLLIVGTDSPDYITPATSVVLQHKLGPSTPAPSTSAAPARRFRPGWPSAAGIMASAPAIRNVLVVGVYLMHKLADPDDPMVFFYGDGAGAAVLQASGRAGLPRRRVPGRRRVRAATGGSTPAATAEPASEEAVRGRARVKMSSATRRRSTTRAGRGSCASSPPTHGFALSDIDHFVIFTQVRKPASSW
jgi:3-oxoacyl-[acyl-carrier-protein] synthase III